MKYVLQIGYGKQTVLVVFLLQDLQRITGINNTFGNNVKINVYPNPAQNMLHISCNTPIGDAQIKMFDMIGHLVYNENLNGSTITKDVDVSNFTKGVYYYQVYSNNKMVAKNKIVVIK